MHLLDVYSRDLNVKRGDLPEINIHFFPINGNYITIHCGDGKINSKTYEYWEEVINLIKFPLLHYGIKIVQIGGEKDFKILNVDHDYRGITYEQSFFIQKNSILHIGIDSLPCHIASAFGKKIVALYGHIYPSQASPAWSNENDIILLEPEWGDKKPSYSAQESPKMIRTIKVEKIVQSIFDLLELKVTLNMKTLHVGQHYHENIFEIVPDFFVDDTELKKHTMHFRMDLRFDEKCLAAWLSRNYKINAISDKVLNLDLLRQFKNNIARVTLIIKKHETFSPEYLKNLKAIGVPLVLIAESEKNISELREKLFDFSIESDDPVKPLENIPKTAKFWTKKIVLSNGKKYPSIAHWRENVPLTNENKIVDCGEFWKDKESFYFYN